MHVRRAHTLTRSRKHTHSLTLPGARGMALGSALGMGLGGGLKGLEVTVEALIKKLEAEQERGR